MNEYLKLALFVVGIIGCCASGGIAVKTGKLIYGIAAFVVSLVPIGIAVWGL